MVFPGQIYKAKMSTIVRNKPEFGTKNLRYQLSGNEIFLVIATHAGNYQNFCLCIIGTEQNGLIVGWIDDPDIFAL